MLFVLFSHLLAPGKADSGSEHRKAGDAGARAVSGGGGGAWMLASHRSGRPPQGRHPEQTLDPRKQPKHGFLVPGAVAAGGGGPSWREVSETRKQTCCGACSLQLSRGKQCRRAGVFLPLRGGKSVGTMNNSAVHTRSVEPTAAANSKYCHHRVHAGFWQQERLIGGNLTEVPPPDLLG